MRFLFRRSGTHDSITEQFSNTRRKTTVKRILLALAVALMFLNSLVIPTAANADGGGGSTSCNGGSGICKP
jgi:hypothetical protein